MGILIFIFFNRLHYVQIVLFIVFSVNSFIRFSLSVREVHNELTGLFDVTILDCQMDIFAHDLQHSKCPVIDLMLRSIIEFVSHNSDQHIKEHNYDKEGGKVEE